MAKPTKDPISAGKKKVADTLAGKRGPVRARAAEAQERLKGKNGRAYK